MIHQLVSIIEDDIMLNLTTYFFACSVVDSRDSCSFLAIRALSLAEAIVHQGIPEPNGLLRLGFRHLERMIAKLCE